MEHYCTYLVIASLDLKKIEIPFIENFSDFTHFGLCVKTAAIRQ